MRYRVSMGEPSILFNSITLAFSLAAIVISIVSSRRQAADDRRSNLLAFLAQMGGRNRSPGFREAQDYIVTDLAQHDPSLGISGLPRPARDHVWEVGSFYQDLGLLVTTGILDEELAAAVHYTGIKEVWRALEPYILSEREHRRTRNAGGFFGSFESLAAYVESVPAEQVLAKFIRRRFTGHSAASLPTTVVDASVQEDPMNS